MAAYDETLPILINQIVAMFLMMAVGFSLFRFKMIDDHSVAHMSNVVLYAASPAIILQSFATQFSFDKLFGALWCFGLSAVITGVAIAITRAIYGADRPLSQMSIIFTNSGFIGLPLVQNVIGPEYAFYVSMCMAAVTFFLWTYGIYLVSQDSREVSLKKVFTNPGVFTLGIGFIVFVGNVTYPEVLDSALSGLGNVNAGLAMVILGAYLAQADIRSLLLDKWVYLASFLRLIIVPAVFLVILMVVPGLSLAVKLTLLITFATPSGGVTAMFSQKYGSNYQYGVGLVAFSTLFSLLSMPAVIALALKVL